MTPESLEQALRAPEPPAFIGIWSRGFAKSTLLELSLVYLGARTSREPDCPLTLADGTQTTLRALEADLPAWLQHFFPEYVSNGGKPIPFASYHLELLRWVQSITGPRDYVIYVSGTQEQAEQHVENIGLMLITERFAECYPRMANRAVGKYGSSRGWRRTRLWTLAGFTIDAAGLDKGIRGARRENIRPRVICFDDLDDDGDSPTVTARKQRRLVRSILPTQGPGCAFIGVQNLILRGGIFTQLSDGTADFLVRRRVSGPHPALVGFDPDRHLQGRPDGGWQITGGTPSWKEGMPLERIQKELLDTYGREVFLLECQHRIQELGHLIYGQFDPEVHEFRWAELPRFVAYYGGIDFGGEGTDAHNSAVVVLGLTANGRLVLLYEWYGNGANVEERQTNAIDEAHRIFGYGIRWAQDGDERTYFQTLRRRAGMHTLRLSKRTPNSAKERRRQFGFMLDVQGDRRARFYYLGRPRQFERDGETYTIGGGLHSQGQGEPVRGASRFRYEVERWHRKPHIAGEEFKDEPVEVDDDVLVAVLYAVERYHTDEDVPQGAQQVVMA